MTSRTAQGVSRFGAGAAVSLDQAGDFGYRPHLDGLRTIAVYLVVAFHAGLGRAANGFIGVDVFFVLSGYLVTHVLVRDVSVHGSIRFARFYARRFRRLFPASAAALIGTAVAYSWVASPGQLSAATDAFRAAFLYFANWFFIGESTDYFATDTARSPVLHFWSLAVEEQFYLFWPLVLAGLLWVGSRSGVVRWGVVRWGVAGLGVASLAWGWMLSADQPTRAYYGTDARVYQMLAGVFIALTPALVTRARRFDRWAPVLAAVSLAGIVVAATPLVSIRPVGRGAAVMVFTSVLLVTLERCGGIVQRFLALRPVVDLGRISYGTYLWHWPVIVVVGEVLDLGPVRTFLMSATVATGLAAASALLLEIPIRTAGRLDRVPRLVCTSALALSLLAGLVFVPVVVDPDRSLRSSFVPQQAAGAILTPVPDDFDEVAAFKEGLGGPVDCISNTGPFCRAAEGSAGHVLLLGDSNARMLQGVFIELAGRYGLTLTLAWAPGCGWQKGYESGPKPENVPRCRELQDLFYDRMLDRLAPDVVVMAGVLESRLLKDTAFGDGPEDRAKRTTTVESVDLIVGSGASMVLIEPIPRALQNFDPLTCLGRESHLESCRFEASDEPHWYELDLRAVAAANEQVQVLDLDRLICPALPICDPMRGDLVVFRDGAHITQTFAMTLADEIAEALIATGRLQR